MCSGSEAGSYLRLTDFCITQQEEETEEGKALFQLYLAERAAAQLKVSFPG